MKMKNKKGALLFAPMLLILMIVGLIYAYSEISAKYKPFKRGIGEKQFELINTYQKGEKAMFYIDQSAKYSAYQSIYDLAKNGGCIGGDIYSKYRLWTVDSPKPSICFPSAEDSKNGFFDFFSNMLNDYLSKYEPTKPLSGISKLYDLSFKDGNLIAAARLYLNMPIIQKKEGLESPGTYTINTSFKVNLKKYDFSDYDKLKSRAREVIRKCEKRVPVNCANEEESKKIFSYENLILSMCLDGKKPVEFLEYKWDSDVRSSIYGFCVKSDKPKVYAYEKADDTIGLKDITYGFALSFEDLKCTLPGHPELVNTKCMEFSCAAYFSCKDATPLCYCTPGTGNSCQGLCLPFCSATNPSLVVDADASTKCKGFSCSSYMSCTTVAADACGCPDPSAAALSNACRGTDCDTFHCDRDPFSDTQCKDICAKYGDCSTTSSCSCGSGLDACRGRCYCNPKEWKNTGGCGDKREDGIWCEWNEIPQKREYDPTTCNSPDYRCERQPVSVCVEPVPTPTPTPTPPAGDSCEGRCGIFNPDASCQCDSTCSDPRYDDCCKDILKWCS